MKGRRLKWCCFIHRGNSLNCWAFQNLPSNVLLPKNNQTWTYFIGKQICSLSFQKKKGSDSSFKTNKKHNFQKYSLYKKRRFEMVCFKQSCHSVFHIYLRTKRKEDNYRLIFVTFEPDHNIWLQIPMLSFWCLKYSSQVRWPVGTTHNICL